MSYYVSDLKDRCDCAVYMDAMWFLGHPDRVRYLRQPYDCERAKVDSPHAEFVSQIVCVQTDKSLNQLASEQNSKRGIIEVPTYRRSFLFMGRLDYSRADSDEEVDQFLAFADDGSGAMTSVSMN